jgi:hypothetical protein
MKTSLYVSTGSGSDRVRLGRCFSNSYQVATAPCTDIEHTVSLI